jgi:diguanylate cyclase (GGDEF)-like protein
MGSVDRMRRGVAGILEWSPVAKGMLLPVLLLPLFGQYLLWKAYIVRRDDATRLSDVVYLESFEPVLLGFMGLSVLLILLGQYLRRHEPAAIWYQGVCAVWYGLSLAWCGYVIGTLTFIAGVVLAGAPLVGFILLERRVVYTAWATSLGALVALAYASASGLIPASPGIVPPLPGDNWHQVFWTTTTLFFAAPHIVSVMVITDFTLGRWREREEAFRTQSLTDALTGVPNRRSILEQFERELARTARGGEALAVVLVDLDHFKRINDTWGHPAGGRVLKAAARTLHECLRQSDAVGRFGGEEFLLVLPATDAAQAARIAERCRQRLQDLQVAADDGKRLPVTGSFGLAAASPGYAGDGTSLIAAADDALYRAKQGGRNRVEAAASAGTA